MGKNGKAIFEKYLPYNWNVEQPVNATNNTYVQRLQRYFYTIVSIKSFISILIYQDQSWNVKTKNEMYNLIKNFNTSKLQVYTSARHLFYMHCLSFYIYFLLHRMKAYFAPASSNLYIKQIETLLFNTFSFLRDKAKEGRWATRNYGTRISLVESAALR